MNSDFVNEVKDKNPDKDVSVNVLGQNALNKFKEAIGKNKEFIAACIIIGKHILSMLSLPVCVKKLGYDIGEIGKEGLYLVKKIGDKIIQIDCIPFDVLGMFAIPKSLSSLGFKIPNGLGVIDKILELSTIDMIGPIKEILKGINMECLTDPKNWEFPDYVYDCIQRSKLG